MQTREQAQAVKRERHCALHAPDEKALKKHGWYSDRDCVMPAEMLRSQAYLTLTETSKVVLQLFLQRRKYELVPKKPGSRKMTRIFVNHGLKFPHTEAREYGITSRSFRRAVLQLWEHGFLVITRIGGQIEDKQTKEQERVCSTYDLIDDWKLYGPGFRPRAIPSGVCFSSGFQAHNHRKTAQKKHLLVGTDYNPIVGTDYKTDESGPRPGVGTDYKNLKGEPPKTKKARGSTRTSPALEEKPGTGDGTDYTVIKARGTGEDFMHHRGTDLRGKAGG